MKEIVLITGKGLLAKRLAEKLLNDDYNVRFLSRKKIGKNDYLWDTKKDYIEKGALDGVRHIIHLAGAGIADKKWTKQRKKEIISSRVDTVNILLNNTQYQKIQIQTFISASAIGYYGAVTTNKILDEDDYSGNDFLSEVCLHWEKAADSFKNRQKNCRLIKFRMGMVLSEQGGALTKIAKPIKNYVGSPLGLGEQFMPWIHIDDLCDMMVFTLKNNYIKGVFNAVAPDHVKNREFIRKLAKKLNKPLFPISIPAAILKLILGEMSVLLLHGSRVSSEKITKSGFRFKFNNLEAAFEDLI